MNHCPGVDPWLSTLSKVCLVLYTVPRRASVGGFAAGTSAPISKDLFSQWKCIEMGIQPAKIATLLRVIPTMAFLTAVQIPSVQPDIKKRVWLMPNHQAFWPSKIGLREAFLAGTEAVRYSQRSG